MTKINKEGWERRQVGEIFAFIKNGANIKQNKDVVGYPITRIETLSGGVFNPEKVGYAGITDLSKYGDYVLENDDILMSHINSKAYIGRAVIYKDIYNSTFIHGMNLLRLRNIAEGVNADYVCAYFQSQEFKANIAKIRKDAVNQSSFAIADLKKINIPLPPLPIQQRIVEELDEINAIISAKKQQLSKLDELAQSIFYNMFGEIQDLVTLSEYIESFSTGKSLAGEEGNANKVLKSGAVTYDYFDKTAVKNLPLDYEPLEANKVKKGDLLVSRMNTPELVGACGYVWEDVANLYLPDRIWRAELRPNANPIFLWKSIISKEAKEQIWRSSSGTSGSMKNISKPNMLRIKVKAVPLPLQETFAARVAAIEEEKAAIAASIEKMQTLLDARMQEYFG